MKWFQHKTDAHRNRKIRKVLRVHGPTGYGIWFALLEKLYEGEGEFQIKADELWLEDFADDLKITDSRTLTRVFDTFAEVGLISRQLWAEQIIYCESIVEKGDQYIKQRAYEAEKKRKQRAKNKPDVPEMSPRDEIGMQGQNANVPLSDPDPDLRLQKTNPDPEKREDPDAQAQEISLFSAPPENLFSEPPEPEQATPVIPEVVSDPSYEAVSVNDSLSIAKFEGSEPNVPGRDRQANIAASGKIRPADTLADQFAGTSSSDAQYRQFKGIYQRFVSLVGANYGTHAKAQQAWAAIEPEIDADFWDGLEAYIAQKQRQFAREGKAIGVKGAANWLLDREWQNALAAEAMHEAAKARGIDLQNPKSVKAAAKQAATQAAFAKWSANRQTEFPDAI